MVKSNPTWECLCVHKDTSYLCTLSPSGHVQSSSQQPSATLALSGSCTRTRAAQQTGSQLQSTRSFEEAMGTNWEGKQVQTFICSGKACGDCWDNSRIPQTPSCILEMLCVRAHGQWCICNSRVAQPQLIMTTQ